jgi:hypothetical protein
MSDLDFFIFTFIFYDFLRQMVQYECNSPICRDVTIRIRHWSIGIGIYVGIVTSLKICINEYI